MTDGETTDNKKGKMRYRKDKEYFKDYFNCALVLHGNVKFLEELKQYIIENYVNTGLVKLIKPMYAKEDFSIVNEPEYKAYKNFKKKRIEKKSPDESDKFYFAFILRGEVKHIEKIRDHIAQYSSAKEVTINYDKERLFIVNKSQFGYFKNTKEGGP